MECTPCPLCGADAAHTIHRLDDWLHDTGSGYCIVRCATCGLFYLNPRPSRDELPQHYPVEYAPYRARVFGGAAGRWRPWRTHGLTKRRRAVTRLAPRGRLLDIGCATGDFLASMRDETSWEVMGLERDSAVAAQARERHGLDVRAADVDEVTFEEGIFDAITLWDVLEHLPSPRETLRRIRPWLKDGGYLVMRVPDGGSPWPRVFGRYWAGFDAPRHLVTFDRRTLGRLLAACGYTVRAQGTLSGTHAMAVLSVYAWLCATGQPRGWGRALDNPIAQALTAPLFWLTDRFLGGALVTVVAQPMIAGDSP